MDFELETLQMALRDIEAIERMMQIFTEKMEQAEDEKIKATLQWVLFTITEVLTNEGSNNENSVSDINFDSIIGD